MSIVLKNVDLLHSLTIELLISSSWSPLHVMTQLASVLRGTSDVDRTLLLLELLHFLLKIHRLHHIAPDRCEWPRTSPTSRAVGLSPSSNFVKHVILSRILALCARSGLSFRTIDSKLPC